MLNSRLEFALVAAALTCSCAQAPESYPPPRQVVMPAGPEPSVAVPAGRLALAMSDPDVNACILRDVYAAPDGSEWRFTGLHPEFRIPISERHGLDFYIRFLVGDDSLLARGPVEFAVHINGHEFRSYRFAYPGDMEYRHPVPDAWIENPGPVGIALDVDPPWRVPDGTVYGLYLNSIGFERRAK